MRPQKRTRDAAKAEQRANGHGDHQEADAATNASVSEDARMESVDSNDESDEDSDEDELTFARQEGAQVEDDDSDEEMEDASEATAGSADRQVNVEFVFLDPREEHFHSVKQFLVSYMPPSQPFDVSGLANAIVNQVTTGTMVCVEGEPDVYGFITALSLQRYANEPSMKQIVQYIRKKCPADLQQQLTSIIETKQCGIVFNERMVNLPYQLVPVLHSALHEDIEWAIENEDTPELRQSFDFEYFLILATSTVDLVASTPANGSGKSKAKGKKTKSETKFYQNFEDEFLEQEADVLFSFEMPKSDRDRSETAKKLTTVMLVKRVKHKAAVGNIAAMINA